VRSVVLLKDETLEIVECPSDAIFALARIRGAGICGVLEDRTKAEAFVKRVSLDMSESAPITPSPPK
jgi:hypothetical protein